MLFDDPISINIALFKTVKTTSIVKPCININISYRGGEYNSLAEMSGGEADRVSLAITLALCRLSSSPILLLDESLSSLNQDLKES